MSSSARGQRIALAVVGVAVALLLWQGATSLRLLGPQFGPAFSPSSAGRALLALGTQGELWPHLGASLRRVLIGLAAAAAVGIPMGMIVGYYRAAEAASSIIFQFLRMVSPLAWMPIAVIAFGVGDPPVYFLIGIAAMWPLVINTAHGISQVNPLWIKVAHSLGAGEGQILRRVIIPAVMPDILTGLRLAVGLAWIVLVPAEMLGVSSGLGYLILDTRDRFRYDELVAAILVIGLLGYSLDSGIRVLQRRLSWTME